MSPRCLVAPALLTALFVPLSACGDDDSIVVVSMVSESGIVIPGVDRVAVGLRNVSRTDRLLYTSKRMQNLTLVSDRPVTFSVSFPESLSGDLEVCVRPQNSAGVVLGAGYGRVAIGRGEVVGVSVLVRAGNGAGVCPAGFDFDPGVGDGGVDAADDGGAIDASGDASPGDAATLLCEPVAAGGCGNNQTCALTCGAEDETRTECTASGTREPGQICTGDADCLPGSQCFMDVCGVRTCRRFCNSQTPCPGGARCVTEVGCSDDGPGSGVRICSQSCDPTGEARTGCAEGLRCFIFPGEVVDCDCVGAQRTGADGDSCQDSSQCSPGHICVTMGGAPTCRPVCQLSNPGCPPNRRCEQLVSPTYETYGACLPL